MKAVQSITYAIYLILSLGNCTECQASLFIPKLRWHFMIFGYFWMMKHGVLLNMINNSIIFSFGYCIYLEIHLFPITPKSEEIKTIVQARQSDIILNCILESTFD